MKLAGPRLDELRREVFFRAGRAGPGLGAIGRGKRWLLLRAWERTTAWQKADLQVVLSIVPSPAPGKSRRSCARCCMLPTEPPWRLACSAAGGMMRKDVVGIEFGVVHREGGSFGFEETLPNSPLRLVISARPARAQKPPRQPLVFALQREHDAERLVDEGLDVSPRRHLEKLALERLQARLALRLCSGVELDAGREKSACRRQPAPWSGASRASRTVLIT